MSCQNLQDGNLKTHGTPHDEQIVTRKGKRVAGSTASVGSVLAADHVVHRFWPMEAPPRLQNRGCRTVKMLSVSLREGQSTRGRTHGMAQFIQFIRGLC